MVVSVSSIEITKNGAGYALDLIMANALGSTGTGGAVVGVAASTNLLVVDNISVNLLIVRQ